MDAEIIVIRNLSREALLQSALELESAIQNAQIVVLPGGFSGGDEPDGSGKFIASFLRSPPCPTRSWTGSKTGTA